MTEIQISQPTDERDDLNLYLTPLYCKSRYSMRVFLVIRIFSLAFVLADVYCLMRYLNCVFGLLNIY
ncbi:hypothetical protein HanXRQr2_Chr09g0390491 [Helianthus annuus]|uniref:Uncharacterized protein n=1 Tax=Helianthus annuus TaxID=4232 RepID=A0A9K3I7P4_HELAN|nr:hypothetical protein HanXRQr2_Chr09g0390491 [Helianthus annuus]